MDRLSNAIHNTLVKSQLIEGFVPIATFANDLIYKELRVSRKIQLKTFKKCYYRWFDAYFQKLEVTYQPYTNSLKRKVFEGLQLEVRRKMLRVG